MTEADDDKFSVGGVHQRAMLARCGALVACLPLLLAVKGYEARPLGSVVLAPVVGASLPDEITLSPGEVVFEQPIAQARVATLGGPVSLSIAGVVQKLPAGEKLEAVALLGDAARSLGPETATYCTTPKPIAGGAAAGKAIVGAIGLGLLGGLQRTELGSRFCLIDADGDGLVERAVLVGAKRAADLTPQSIPPTPVKVEQNAPLPQPSAITMRYLGKVGLIGNLGLEVTVHDGERKLALDEYRKVVAPRKLPATVNVHGAELDLVSFDTTQRVVVRRRAAFPVGPLQIAPERRTTYIYVPG